MPKSWQGPRPSPSPACPFGLVCFFPVLILVLTPSILRARYAGASAPAASSARELLSGVQLLLPFRSSNSAPAAPSREVSSAPVAPKPALAPQSPSPFRRACCASSVDLGWRLCPPAGRSAQEGQLLCPAPAVSSGLARSLSYGRHSVNSG